MLSPEEQFIGLMSSTPASLIFLAVVLFASHSFKFLGLYSFPAASSAGMFPHRDCDRRDIV